MWSKFCAHTKAAELVIIGNYRKVRPDIALFVTADISRGCDIALSGLKGLGTFPTVNLIYFFVSRNGLSFNLSNLQFIIISQELITY